MLKFIVAAALIAGTSIPALADRGEIMSSVKVHYADLNLGSPEGQRVLQRRLATAIDSVCGSAEVRDLGSALATYRCKRDTARSTAPQVAAVTKNVAFASASTRFEGGSR